MNRDQMNFALHLIQTYGEDVAANYVELVESPDYLDKAALVEPPRVRGKLRRKSKKTYEVTK